MHQRTAKAAIPKLAQLRRSAEAKETMGHLSKKKKRPPKQSFQASRSAAPAYWQKLILNWHNYSLAQKIAVITAGLVLSGVALYIAVGLAQSVYANMSAELDTPSRTREPSVFTRMDRALSFPIASAARITPPKLFELYPEFLEGTDEHEKDIKKEMEKGFREIDEALYPFLQQPTQKSKVIAVLETHTESFIFKNLLFAYLRTFSDHTQAKITVVHEFGMISSMREKVREFYLDMLAFHNPQTAHTRKSVASHFNTNCFSRDYSTVSMKKMALILCTLQAAGAYNFKFVPADAMLIDPASEGTINRIYSLRTKKTYNFPLSSVSSVDESLNITLQEQLSLSQPTDVILCVMGAAHGKVMSGVLETSDHPYLLLRMQNPASAFWTQQLPLFKKFINACVMKMKHCPPAIHKSAKAQNIEYCVDGNYGSNKHCDEQFHNRLADVKERYEFARSTHVSQTLPVLPERNPQKITDFFAPKSSIKILEAKLEKDKKKAEKQDNQRMEL